MMIPIIHQRNTNRVAGFLGPQNPCPLPDSEVARILNQVEEGLEKPRSLISFDIGDQSM